MKTIAEFEVPSVLLALFDSTANGIVILKRDTIPTPYSKALIRMGMELSTEGRLLPSVNYPLTFSGIVLTSLSPQLRFITDAYQVAPWSLLRENWGNLVLATDVNDSNKT